MSSGFVSPIGGSAHESASPRRRRSFGPLAVAATVLMLFVGFAAAITVRRGDPDWVAAPIPTIAWIGAGLLVLSVFCLGRALALASRGRGAQGRPPGAEWIALTCLLGTLFLSGQVGTLLVWADRGLTPTGGPFGAFAYLLTAVHGLFVLGGVGALVRLLARGARRPSWRGSLSGVVLYWFAVVAAWLGMLVLLS